MEPVMPNQKPKSSGNWLKYLFTFMAGGAVVAIAFFAITGQYLTGSVFKVKSDRLNATQVETISKARPAALEMEKTQMVVEEDTSMKEEIIVPEVIKEVESPCKDGCYLENMIVDLRADIAELQNEIGSLENQLEGDDDRFEQRVLEVVDPISNDTWARMNRIDTEINNIHDTRDIDARDFMAYINAIMACSNTNACVNTSWQSYQEDLNREPFSSATE